MGDLKRASYILDPNMPEEKHDEAGKDFETAFRNFVETAMKKKKKIMIIMREVD